jgi:hypothetical protein
MPEFVQGLILFISLIAPGYLSILVFSPALLIDVSFATLLFLAFSISALPLFCVMLVVSIVSGVELSLADEFRYFVSYCQGATASVFYPLLLISSTFSLSWRVFIRALVVLPGALAYYAGRSYKTEKK